MADTESIRGAFERNEKVVRRMASVAAKTAVSRGRIVDGLLCEVEEGRWKVVSDLHEKSGGTGAGPDPSVLGRAAFTSCLAMGIVLWGAKLGVPISDVEVEVETDYDARGQYGVEGVPAGFSEVRYTVSVTSPAPREELERVLHAAETGSPWHDVFARPQRLVGRLHVKASPD